MAQMTWSKTLGFLERGEDVDNMISTLETDMHYFAPVSGPFDAKILLLRKVGD
jgi:hypothetical protein